jgi:hypothetical protein
VALFIFQIKKERIYMADNKSRGVIGELKVNADVSDAIKGLKAVQREARKAMKEVRELESYFETEGRRLYMKWTQKGTEVSNVEMVDLSRVPTEILAREMNKRGVAVEDQIKENGKNPVYFLSGLRDYSTEDLAEELARRKENEQLASISKETIIYKNGSNVDITKK